eukprot:scaffold37224_cov66-Phaeocystis_antarctica.AAC.2
MASRDAARSMHTPCRCQPERQLPPARRQRPRRGPVSQHDQLAPALIVTLTLTLTRRGPVSQYDIWPRRLLGRRYMRRGRRVGHTVRYAYDHAPPLEPR